jgi:hypothetical protein
MMPLSPMSEFHKRAFVVFKREVPNMLSPVSTSDPRQNAQSLLVQQKQAQEKRQDDARKVQNNQQPSTLNAQRTENTAENQPRPEIQNSQQAKGASLDVRA